MKLTKSLKLTIVVTLLLLVASIVLLALNKVQLSSDYHDSVKVTVNFSSADSTDLDSMKKIFKKVEKLDTVEATTSNNYVGNYLELKKSDEEKLKNEFSKVNGYQNFTVTKVHKVNSALHSFLYVGPLSLVWFIFTGFVTTNMIKKGHDRIGLLFANFLQVAYLGIIGAGVLSAISYFYPVTRELLEFTIFLVLLGWALSAINLFRLNLYFKDRSYDNFLKELVNVEERYDRSYVVNVLLVALLITPFVIISHEPVYFAIAAIVLMGVNIYVETYSFIHFFVLWQLAITKLPVIKNLKWTRK